MRQCIKLVSFEECYFLLVFNIKLNIYQVLSDEGVLWDLDAESQWSEEAQQMITII